MSNKKVYKFQRKFYIIMSVVAIVILGIIFKGDIKKAVIFIGEVGREKRVEIFNPESTKKENYFVFTSDSGYAVYGDKMIIKLSKGLKFSKNRNFSEMLNAQNYREILNYYNLNVPEKIKDYYIANKVTGDFDSSAINIPLIRIKQDEYADSRVLSQIFMYRYYQIDEKNDSDTESLYADILNATEKERYNTETIRKLKKVGYSCSETNYGEVLQDSFIINNKVSSDELKKFVLSVNEKYIKIKNEPPFVTIADIVFIAGSEKDVKVTIEIFGTEKEEMYNVLSALGYFNINKNMEEKQEEKSYISCSAEDYYIAYKISKILKIDNIIIKEGIENKIEIYSKGEKK